MRIGTAVAGGIEHPAVELDGVLRRLDVPTGTTLADLIRAARDALAAAEASSVPLDDARLTAPLRPGKIVAIGLNYLDRVRRPGWTHRTGRSSSRSGHPA
jgi:5-carboxymethyl-2-hydroxymuconate isomerase